MTLSILTLTLKLQSVEYCCGNLLHESKDQSLLWHVGLLSKLHVHVGELTKNNGGDKFSYTDTSKGQRMTNEHSGDKAEGNVDLDRDR